MVEKSVLQGGPGRSPKAEDDSWGVSDDAPATSEVVPPRTSGIQTTSGGVLAAEPEFPDVPTEIGKIPEALFQARLAKSPSETPVPTAFATDDGEMTRVYGRGMAAWASPAPSEPPPAASSESPEKPAEEAPITTPPRLRPSKVDSTLAFKDPDLLKKLREMGKDPETLGVPRVSTASKEASVTQTSASTSQELVPVRSSIPWYRTFVQWLLRLFGR